MKKRNVSNEMLEQVAKLEPLEDVKQVEKFLFGIREVYGLANIVYRGKNVGEKSNDPMLLLTYCDSWVRHYLANNYFDIDPVEKMAFSSSLPLDWNEINVTAPETKKLFGEASEFGVGKQGLTFHVTGARSDESLLTITSNDSFRDWTQNKSLYTRDFLILGHYLHNRIAALSHSKPSDKPALSNRETQCLAWASKGKTVFETSIIIGVSSRAVRLYLDLARHKLNVVNKTSAVAEAIHKGLI